MQVEDYMNETPLRLLEMLTQTREDLWRAAQAITERGVTRIILTGSGTSYHGALTARAFMQRWCALPVDVYWPFMLDDETLTRSGKALVVGISQGGGSLSTLAAMERARDVGHVTASMAGVTPATIDRAADYILTVPCGEETAGAKTKGYHCTVLNLMLLALAVAGRQQRLDGEQRRSLLLRMEKTFNHLPALITASQAWTQTHALALRDSADVRLTGPATLFGTVQEGRSRCWRRCAARCRATNSRNLFTAFTTPLMRNPPSLCSTRSLTRVRIGWRKYSVTGHRLFTASARR